MYIIYCIRFMYALNALRLMHALNALRLMYALNAYSIFLMHLQLIKIRRIVKSGEECDEE